MGNHLGFLSHSKYITKKNPFKKVQAKLSILTL